MLKVKKLILIDGEYENVVITNMKPSEIEEMFPNLIKVIGDNFTVFINPDMVMSLELECSNGKTKEISIIR